jgi:DNA-binding transcriptional LysR family regulator
MLRRRRVFIEKSNRPIEWRDARNYKPLLPMAERWTLDDLRVFCAVAETGSLTSAAAAVGLSLPAVSARLKALEQTFAATLCQRSHKGVALTPAGNRLHAHARDLLEKASLVTEDVSEYGSAARGIVRVVSNTTAVTEHLPDLLATFLARHPQVDVALVEAVSSEVLKQVREGQGDIGIFTHGPPVDDLVTIPFRNDRLVLIVNRHHPLAGRPSIQFHETLLSNQVCLQQTAALFGFLAQRARDQGRRLVSRIHVAGFDAMARLVGRGVGVAVMPESAARRLKEGHQLSVVTLQDAWADNPLVLCHRGEDSLSPSARALLSALAAPGPSV